MIYAIVLVDAEDEDVAGEDAIVDACWLTIH